MGDGQQCKPIGSVKIGLDTAFYANVWHGVAQGFERLSTEGVRAIYFHHQPVLFSSSVSGVDGAGKTLCNVQLFFIRCI
ncbi:hypothetical protein AGJ34_07975 [Cronobacter dublinensis subsp. dublinensis]|nr:hypothetical protein [Cronobacter dublinensis subsp. dublinensis]NCH95054.1 hypothetical protein [Cronobacter dublinensis]EGT5667982.1 hypothetical protein [Cronobacter dublinensis subsp. dublinensis]EGT5672956.1 hypothetical protein [Cronobacter dublinensis subsp. dublinensis]EGT5677687.1 hypothetical protein [Cronobacter dublinensis subsp. dublinensis]